MPVHATHEGCAHAHDGTEVGLAACGDDGDGRGFHDATYAEGNGTRTGYSSGKSDKTKVALL